MKIQLSLTALMIFMCNARALAYEGQDKTLIFSGAYVAAQDSYKLDGKGFTASSGPVDGSGAAAGVRWNRSDSSFALEYLNVDSNHSTPSGLSPTSVESKFKRYHLSYRPVSSEGYGGWGQHLEYGLEVRQRTAGPTSPNMFISSHDSMGVRVGAVFNFNEGHQTYFESGFGLYVPLYHDERSSKTGYYKFSVNPDVKIGVVHDLTDLIALSASVSAIWEQIYYSGTGSRGTSRASESFLNLQVPIELRFKF